MTSFLEGVTSFLLVLHFRALGSSSALSGSAFSSSASRSTICLRSHRSTILVFQYEWRSALAKRKLSNENRWHDDTVNNPENLPGFELSVLVLDNYDSFVYNLVQQIGGLGASPIVVRNDVMTVEEVASLNPDAIVISPGPGRPEGAGISLELIEHFHQTTPILGVCLGHQCIGAYFGALVVHAPEIKHGKTSPIYHDGRAVFEGVTNPLIATRYHSLILEPSSIGEDLLVVAHTSDNLVMGVRHSRFPVYGVQFHPESVLTTEGTSLMANFLQIADRWKQGIPIETPRAHNS